jgi:hypothetical protein
MIKVKLVSINIARLYKYLSFLIIVLLAILVSLMLSKSSTAIPYLKKIDAPVWLYLLNIMFCLVLIYISYFLIVNPLPFNGELLFEESGFIIHKKKTTRSVKFDNLELFMLKFSSLNPDNCFTIEFKLENETNEFLQVYADNDSKEFLISLSNKLKLPNKK